MRDFPICVFSRNKKDMILLRHEVGISWPDGRKEERGINLVCYGDGDAADGKVGSQPLKGLKQAFPPK